MAVFFSFFIGIFGLKAVDKTIEGRVAKLEAEVSSLAALHTTIPWTRTTTITLTISFEIYGRDTVSVGESTTFEASNFRGANGMTPTDTSVSWSTSDPGVATIDTSGLVTGISQGDCIITATASDGGGAHSSVGIQVILCNPYR